MPSIFENKRRWASISAMIAILAALGRGAIYLDDRYVTASTLDQFKTDHLITKWTFEESLNAIRIDIIEDRIWREKEKEGFDIDQLSKWKKQVISLESRQTTILANKEQIEIFKVTQD